ncbi:MAG: DUF2029 domain-containing protein [Elusimicrobia bacterium]|nr:DUF2029 domain-containing protein [Elusimicrobiota bacterium]
MKKFFLTLLLILTVLNTLNYIKFLNDKTSGKIVDFHLYYNSAKNLFKNDISPYFATDLQVKGEGQYYIYPPSFLIFFAPLTLFPEKTAGWLWILFNILIFLGGGYWFVSKIFGPDKKQDKLTLFLMHYNFNPFFLCIFIGQVDIVILLLIYVSIYLILANKKNFTGVVIGIMALIKLTPVIFFLYFLVKRNIKAILWFIAAILTFFILSVLILQNGIYSDFFSAMSAVRENSDRYIMPLSKSIFALLGRMFLDNRLSDAAIIHSPVLFNLFYIISVFSFIIIIYFRRIHLNDIEIFALITLLAVIVLPNALIYSMVLMFPALLLFYGKIKTSRNLGLFIIIFLSVTFHYSLYFLKPVNIIVDFIPLFGNILLFGLLVTKVT